MNKLKFQIDIKAPKEKVWDVMLADKTYREWTGVFQPGSCYEGSWEKGSRIRFVSEDDQKLSGMSSKIVENIPYKYISIEHVGEIIDGKEDTTSESAKQWIGSHENYTFNEKDGITSLIVEMEGAEVTSEMIEMFEDMWPKALDKLKEIAETS